MTPDEKQTIENSPKFRFFLQKFWVKGIEEYRSFSESEQQICLEEYKKTQK